VYEVVRNRKPAETTKMPPKFLWAAQKQHRSASKKEKNLPNGIKGSGTPDAVTGCHFTGPVALRHILSDVLPECVINLEDCYAQIISTPHIACQLVSRNKKS
jgi:hypothetical protein